MNVIVFGKDQKVMTYSDTVNADKIISSAIIVYDKFTTILWQYIIFLFWMVYLSSKQETSDFSPLSRPKTIAFLPSEAKTQKIKRIDHNK